MFQAGGPPDDLADHSRKNYQSSELFAKFATGQVTWLAHLMFWPFQEKILCILCIHVNQNLFRASMNPLPGEFCKRLVNLLVSIRGSSFFLLDNSKPSVAPLVQVVAGYPRRLVSELDRITIHEPAFAIPLGALPH